MPQTVVTLISELQPHLATAACKLIELLKAALVDGKPAGDPTAPIITAVPGLHFASMMVFEDERFDPVLTLELNFDGPVGAFLPRLETPVLSPHLRAILRCCKPPEDRRRAMYEAVTTAGSRVPVAPYLETLVVAPAVFHQGNRGLDRVRILREAALYTTVQTALDADDCREAADAASLHAALRVHVAAAHPWLDEAVVDRVPAPERLLDLAKLIGLVLAVAAILLAPGFLLWLVSPSLAGLLAWIAVAAVLALAVAFATTRKPASQPAPPRAPQLPPATTSKIAKFAACAGAAALLVLVGCLFLPWLRAAAAGLVLIVVGALVWLRRLETTDKVHTQPKIDPHELREIMKLEDRISQNHMGSIVHVKPGVLRAILIRLGLAGLGLLLRVSATDGYLAFMRTIHFAHWALIDNGSRLLFFSNFDSSWESYLDDFIEKAHGGLTLAWSNAIGFPRTRFLLEDGATNGLLFKTWARHSMARSLFWVSAYPDLSVNQIERNCDIAAGLRAASLSGEAARTWAALL